MSTAGYGDETRRKPALHRQRHRQPASSRSAARRSTPARSPRSCLPVAAGGRRRRGQCRDRLSRHRIPALGPGPERHRPRRRQPALHRLRRGEACTGGNCDRRADYLSVVTGLLVDDLEDMAAQWQPDGAARKAVTADRMPASSTILTGLGCLSYGELAGERMKLGLMLHDPEEEQDCFSDNTHNSHYYDVVGMRNVYLGQYTRIDGTPSARPVAVRFGRGRLPGPTRVRRLDASLAAAARMKTRAETAEAYDQMIGEGNEKATRWCRPHRRAARPDPGHRTVGRRAEAGGDHLRELRQPRRSGQGRERQEGLSVAGARKHGKSSGETAPRNNPATDAACQHKTTAPTGQGASIFAIIPAQDVAERESVPMDGGTGW